MCAIIDANVISQVFGSDRPAAGKEFFNWISTGNGRLVVGAKLLKELDKGSFAFRQWAKEGQISGRMRRPNEDQVTARTQELREQALCRSNDPHIIALAQASGARLLYSNDRALQQDFKDKSLIDNPRGKVFTTLKHQDYSRVHKKLLADRELCRVRQ